MTGSEFQKRRKATGLSQRDLADYWQVGKSTVARLETTDGHVKRVYALALMQLEMDPELYDMWRDDQAAEKRAWDRATTEAIRDQGESHV